MNQIFSYLLVVSFFTLLVPRDMLHECSHKDLSHKFEHHDETQIDQEDCFVCYFDLGQISQPLITTFHFEKSIYPKNPDSKEQDNYLKADFFFGRRGPPQL